MIIKHSIRNLFLFLLVIFPINWFVFTFPYQTATELFSNLPNYVNSSIVSQYPDDLKITVKNGMVGLNRTSPYCLKLNNTDGLGIVFDTVSEPKVDAFEANGPYSSACQPAFVVGKNYFMYLDKEQIKISKITDQANFSLDKPTIANFVDKYLPMVISFGKNVYFSLPFVGVIFAFLFYLLNNYWYAFIAKLILKIFKLSPTKSSDVYRVTLFFYTVINFIQFVVVNDIINQLFKTPFVLTFPFMNTILITIATVIYFKNNREEPALQNSISTPEIR